MKKLILSVVLSTPLLVMAVPGFSASSSALYNPETRTDAAYAGLVNVNSNLPQAGTKYAYWHRWHRWHYWHRNNYWHRWHRNNYWHHWHHW